MLATRVMSGESFDRLHGSRANAQLIRRRRSEAATELVRLYSLA